MCGRYAFYSPSEAVAHLFDLDDVPEIEPRYNIAPTQFVPVVREVADAGRKVVMLRWGLVPFWAKEIGIGNRMINARAETIAEKPAYRAAFRRRRCLLLATGFYEWQAGRDGKTPTFIQMRDGAPFAMAGLWETWQPKDEPDADVVETCTIITTGANELLKEVHHRMPVILPKERIAAWLDPGNEDREQLVGLLAPYSEDEMRFYAVSREVNSPRNEGAGLVEPAASSG